MGSSPTSAIMKNSSIINRIDRAIEETSSIHAKSHEQTTECLSCLLEDIRKIVKNSEDVINDLETKLFDSYRQNEKFQGMLEMRRLFDEQSG